MVLEKVQGLELMADVGFEVLKDDHEQVILSRDRVCKSTARHQVQQLPSRPAPS